MWAVDLLESPQQPKPKAHIGAVAGAAILKAVAGHLVIPAAFLAD